MGYVLIQKYFFVEMDNNSYHQNEINGKESIMKHSNIMAIVLDDTNISNHNIEKQILESDVVVDITRPYYRNKLEFRSDKVKEICAKDINTVYIDGNPYAIKYFREAKNRFMKWVVNKPNEKIFRNKSLKELFVYDNNISLWWLTKISHKNFNKTEVPTYFNQEVCIKYILSDYRHFFSDNSIEYKIYLFSSNKVEFNYFSSIIKKELYFSKNEEKFPLYEIINPLEHKKKSFSLLGILPIIIKTVKMMLNLYRVNLMSGSKSSINKLKNYDHLIVTNFPGDWFSQTDKVSFEKRDRYLDELYTDLSKEGLKIAYFPILKSPEELKEWEKIENKPSFIHIKFSSINILFLFFRYISYQIYWYTLFCLLYNQVLKKIVLYNQEMSSDQLLNLITLIDLRNVINQTGINYLYHYDLFKNFIGGNTKSILLVQEYYAKSRVIKAAIKNSKTRIFGVQHGSASRMYYQYEFHSSETGMTRSNKILNKDYVHHVPVPDYNFLFGSYHKNILMGDDGYPASRLIVTGPLRNDLMAKKSIIINNNEIINIKIRLGIPLDRKILLFCSSHKLKLSILSFIVESINRSNSKPYFLIKLHPVIDKRTKYLDYMKEFVSIKHKFINSKIDELIFCSDLVVSELSNVAYESVICNRPHLVISKDIDLCDSPGFLERPVIMSSKEVNETSNLIDKMIMDSKFKKQYYEKRAPFLKKYFFNLDGQAIKRAGLFLDAY